MNFNRWIIVRRVGSYVEEIKRRWGGEKEKRDWAAKKVGRGKKKKVGVRGKIETIVGGGELKET